MGLPWFKYWENDMTTVWVMAMNGAIYTANACLYVCVYATVRGIYPDGAHMRVKIVCVRRKRWVRWYLNLP